MAIVKSTDYNLDWLAYDDIQRVPDPVVLVEGLIYEGDRILIGGIEKLGKSYLLLQMMAELVHGRPVWGTYESTRPMRVMLLQFEIGLPMFKMRYNKIYSQTMATDRA